VTQRNALRRNYAGTPPELAALWICGKIQRGTPAARRWLPQSLAETDFFRDVFFEWKRLSVRFGT